MHSVAEDTCDKSVPENYYYNLFIFTFKKNLNTAKEKNMLKVRSNDKKITQRLKKDQYQKRIINAKLQHKSPEILE